MNRLLIFMLLMFAGAVQAFEFPEAKGAWIREAPPTVKMLAGYVALNNQGKNDLTLIGAYSPAFGVTEIHQTVESDGVYKMIEQSSLTIKAGDTLTMQPKGLHLMLMMPKRRLTADQEVKICLIYANGEGQTEVQHLMFQVKKQ